ncbi:MAG: hypothetical protein ABI408_06435 [Gemmatimonadaceae bacterium]
MSEANKEPERVLRPVIKTRAGKIVDGAIHPRAANKAREQNHLTLDQYLNNEYDEGYSTTQRDFVGREEADNIAAVADQLTLPINEDRSGGLDASELKDWESKYIGTESQLLAREKAEASNLSAKSARGVEVDQGIQRLEDHRHEHEARRLG